MAYDAGSEETRKSLVMRRLMSVIHLINKPSEHQDSSAPSQIYFKAAVRKAGFEKCKRHIAMQGGCTHCIWQAPRYDSPHAHQMPSSDSMTEGDLGWLWENDQLSDVRVRLCQAAASAPSETSDRSVCPDAAAKDTHEERDQDCCWELPGHSVVLASVSGYWKTRILRWSPNSNTPADISTDSQDTCAAKPSRHPVLEEQVDTAADLVAARDVLCYGYTRKLPEAAPVSILLQMAVWADKWDMPQTRTACLEQAAAVVQQSPLPAEELSWLLQDNLPDSITVHTAYKAARSKCAAELIRRFRHGRDIMMQPSVLESFCNLSLQAVQLWAKDYDMRVDSENTVAVLFTHWWVKNSQDFSEEQEEAAATVLTESVRAGQLSKSFIMCVMCELPWFRPSKAAAAVLRQLHNIAWKNLSSDVLDMMPCACVRPSRLGECQYPMSVEWRVPRAELDDLREEAGDTLACLYCPEPLYCLGYKWTAVLKWDQENKRLWFGAVYKSALPEPYDDDDDELPPVLPAKLALVVTAPAGPNEVSLTKGEKCPMLWNMIHGSCYMLSGGDGSDMYPPSNLWQDDGHLHLKVGCV